MKIAIKTITTIALLTVLLSKTQAQPFSGGQYNSMFLCSDSTVRATGDNFNFGQVGDNTNILRTTAVQVHGYNNVGFLTGVIAIANVPSYHSVALKSDGTVWAWGDADQGALGNNNVFTNKRTPIQVFDSTGTGATFLSNITAISTGYFYNLALQSNGTMWAWGLNANGRLGDSTTTRRDFPVRVHGRNNVGILNNITAISAGGWGHSLALADDSTVWSWGYGNDGSIGDNGGVSRWYPVKVVNTTGVDSIKSIKKISSGGMHSLLLKNNGTVYSFGRNWAGEIGDNTTITKFKPAQVVGPLAVGFLDSITEISAGFDFSLALHQDGTLWTWGSNAYGQLGINSTTNSSVPVQVMGVGGTGFLTGIVAIAAGAFHAFALKNDGTVYAWGYNGSGQLSDGTTTTPRTTPVVITAPCTLLMLPIELLNFSATLLFNKTVLCQWTTSTEINNDYFTVEKTKDAINYEFVGQVKGAGNSNSTLSYQLIDSSPEQGISYYRLKQTDFDGKYTYSQLVPVNLSGVDIISIAPNPVIDNFEYKIGSTEKMTVQVKVVDILGQIVINKTENIEKGITSKRLDVSGISSGTYILQLITENKEVVGKQFQIK